jgi:hypothetical protein
VQQYVADFEERRPEISAKIAQGLLDAINRTRNSDGEYRVLTDREFLAEEIRIFTGPIGEGGLNLPTEAYPGHDMIDLFGLDVQGSTEGLWAYRAADIFMAALGQHHEAYYLHDGVPISLAEAQAAGLTIAQVGPGGITVVYDGDVPLAEVRGVFEYPAGGTRYYGDQLTKRDGILYADIDGVSTAVGLSGAKTFGLLVNLGLVEVGNDHLDVIRSWLSIAKGTGDRELSSTITDFLVASGECFAAGTSITLSNAVTRPIEQISVGDLVQSYNEEGLVEARVTDIFKSEVAHLIDVHGLQVTPGHVTLCGGGRFAGKHVPIIDILLSDGALVRENGDPVRIAINKLVGSMEDHFVQISYAVDAEAVRSGSLKSGKIRVGTLLFDRDCEPVSVLDCIKAEGLVFDAETGLVSKEGGNYEPLYFFGELPRPEDYILRRSRETLEGILADGEWEGAPSQLVAQRLRQTQSMKLH